MSPTTARSSFALVTDPTFGPYFAGNLASNIGTWFGQVTSAVVVFDITDSTFMVGLVAVSQFLPSLVLAPWTGAAADIYDRRRLLIAAQTVAAGAVAVLAIVTITLGLDRFPGAWPVLAAAVAVGLVHALSTPAQQALVPALVPPSDLDQAVALNSVSFNLARAVGPALGAAVLVAWGPGPAYSVNAISYGALVFGLMVIRTDPAPRTPRSSIWSGIRHLRTDPTLALLLVGVTALGFGADPIITLTPALAEGLVDDTFTNADSLVGLLISAFGTGAVGGLLVVTRLRRRFGHVPVAMSGLILLGTGMLVLAAAPTAVLAMMALAFGGAGFLIGVTCLTSAMLLRTPEGLRGRIMALWGVAFLGSRPVAASIDGIVADLLSARAATVVAAAAVMVCVIFLRKARPEA